MCWTNIRLKAASHQQEFLKCPVSCCAHGYLFVITGLVSWAQSLQRSAGKQRSVSWGLGSYSWPEDRIQIQWDYSDIRSRGWTPRHEKHNSPRHGILTKTKFEYGFCCQDWSCSPGWVWEVSILIFISASQVMSWHECNVNVRRTYENCLIVSMIA